MASKFLPICFLALVCLLSPNFSIAQETVTFESDSGRSFTIKNIVNDPDKFPPLRFGASLSHLSEPLIRNNESIRLSAEYRAGEWGYVHFVKDLPIFDFTDRQYKASLGSDRRLTENPTNRYTYTESGVGIRVWRYQTQRVDKLSLKAEDADSDSVYIMTSKHDLKVDHIVIARTGFLQYRNTVTNAYVEGKELRTKDGQIIASKADYYGNEKEKPLNDPMEDLQNLYQTNMFVNAIYLGAEFTSRYNLGATLKETGERDKNSNLLRFYGDVLFATSVNFEPLILSQPGNLPTNVKVDHNNEGGLKARNTGFRIGFHYQHYTGIQGVNVRLETGIRPGMKNVDNPYGRSLNDWFLTIDLGIGLGLDPGIL